MKQKRLATYALLFIAVGNLTAAQVTFTAGMPALAADVNANFTELYNAKWTRTGADLSYSGGNVGIGIASPGVPLHVTGGSIFLDQYHASAGAPASLSLRRARGTEGSPAAILSGDTIGYLNSRGYDGTGFFYGALIAMYATENWSATNRGTKMEFHVIANGTNGTAPRMTIDNTGFIGIGIATPKAPLEIYSDAPTAVVPNSSGTAVKAFMRIGDSGGNVLDIGGAGGGPPYPYWLQVHNQNNQATNGPLLLNPNGGNVGVGTANPGAKLTLTQATSTNTEGLRLINGGATWNVFGGSGGTLELELSGQPSYVFRGDGYLALPGLYTATANALCYNTGLVPGKYTISLCTSSKKYKENIQVLKVSRTDIFKLRPVSFKWKGRNEYDIGLIAEEVNAVVPALSIWDKGRLEGVKYSQLTVYLLDIARQQEGEITALKSELARKDARLTRLEKMESRLAQLESSLSRVAQRIEGNTVARR